MSRWVADPNSDSGSPEGAGGGRTPAGVSGNPEWPLWIQVVPFFLSAILFLSAFFAIFSPLPLLILRFRSDRRALLALASVTNAGIVALAGGWSSLVVYTVFVVVLAATIGETLRRFRSLEKTAFAGFLAILISGGIVLLTYSVAHKTHPATELGNQVTRFVDAMVETMSVSLGEKGRITGPEAEELRDKFMRELPAAMSVFSLALIVLNLVMLLRINPRGLSTELGISPTRLRYWRAPEFLVWPTIAVGALLILGSGLTADVAMSVFKFLMAIYAIQGLSIVSFFFDLWQIKGIFRTAGYLTAIFLMMPLLLSLGFFDLWFDFRSKFRHS